MLIVFLASLLAFMPLASVSAQTSQSQMQAEISRLAALIEQLTRQLNSGGTIGVNASIACPYAWTRSLTIGSTGADVQKLQQFLNASPDTRLALSGAGSPGQESLYFGPITAAAVSKFQVKYRADILTPVGLVNPTGYFGPSTIAKANALCVSKPATPPVGNDDEEDDDEVRLRGEGTLRSFEINDADDTEIEENEKDASIAELALEARDGDIELDRMDITLAGVDSPSEDDPWDVFEDIALWVDGDLVKRVHADDENDYLDEDDGIIRLSNLNIILEQNEEVEMMITVTVQNGVDAAGIDANWSVAVEGVRYFDGDGVATREESVDELGIFANFEIVPEGEGEELKFSLAEDNPDVMDIIVDADDTTDEVTILVYTIEAKDNDIELNNLFVTVVTSATTSEIVDDIELIIDGQHFRDEGSVVNSALSTTYEFDIDDDVVIDEDDEVEVEVVVDLKAQEGRYDNGDTIRAQVTSTERDATDAEGADDIDEFSGTAVGDDHTLVAEGIVVPRGSVDTSTDTLGNNDTIGEFAIEFEVTAIEGDFYITEDTNDSASTATTGVAYRVDGPVSFIAGSSTVSAVLSSSADEDSDGVFTVREGESETFTLMVTVDPNVGGQYRVGLTEVNFDDHESGRDSTESYVPTPTQDYRTSYRFINS